MNLETATLAELQRVAHDNACDKGWWDGYEQYVGGFFELTPDQLLSKLMLITTEVAEAAEDVRVGAMTTTGEPGAKPCGFPSELADIMIRCFDLAGALGIDLQHEVVRKMLFNATRPARHGGKLA